MEVVFHVDKLVIAYIMQVKGVRDFGVGREEWNRLLANSPCEKKYQSLVSEIQNGLQGECVAAHQLKLVVEVEWRLHEKNVLAWLRELTKLTFKESTVKVSVVPFSAGQTPFRNIPLIVIGRIRESWGYAETIAHELAHILFNQNLRLESEIEHSYVQLIEEEIAVRLGARPKYFDYEIPLFAEWVRRAQQKEKSWRRYLEHIGNYKDIAEFIEENESTG